MRNARAQFKQPLGMGKVDECGDLDKKPPKDRGVRGSRNAIRHAKANGMKAKSLLRPH